MLRLRRVALLALPFVKTTFSSDVLDKRGVLEEYLGPLS